MESLFEKAGYMKYRDGSDGHNIIYKSLSDEKRLIIFIALRKLIYELCKKSILKFKGRKSNGDE